MVSIYSSQLDALWSRLSAAAEDRPAVQSLWARDSDPRVTRLVQAAAYLFARARGKLEDDVPEASQALVASSLPEVLRPFPSATVVAFRDERRVRRMPSEIPAASKVESRPIGGVPCTFRTSWSASLAPLTLSGLVHTREAGVTLATLTLTAYPKVPLALAVPNALRIFVRTAEPAAALDVVRGVCEAREPVSLRVLDAGGRELATRELPQAPRWTALGPDAHIVHGAPHDRFASGTLMRAFFGFPELFAFFELSGLCNALTGLDERARSVEISLRLAGTVQAGAYDAEFHADCAPAANVFEARSVPLSIRGLGSAGALTVAGAPGREVFHVQRLALATTLDPNRPVPVALWERGPGQSILDGALYARLERGENRLGVELVRPDGGSRGPHGKLVADVLATDGLRTSSLLPGDVGTNLTRVTPPRPAVLGGRVPWRVNAFARIPCARFSTAASLAAYLDLHDPTRSDNRERGTSPAAVGVLSVARRGTARVRGSEVRHGERIEVELEDSVFGGPGATWLAGELLARAIAERTDFLRFAHTRLVAHGETVADYGYREGERLPPPFG